MKEKSGGIKTVFKLEKISKWGNDFLHLIYPNTCLICENELSSGQKYSCTFCENELHYTYFERFTEPTPLDQLFWGRVKVDATYAYLYFEKEKSVQPILHALKYKNKPEIGVKMGVAIGKQIKELSNFNDLDALIPVPLHPKKEFIRGYNQSEKIADGIASELHIPVQTDFIKRIKHSESQTQKSRFLRWDNVEKKFRSSKKDGKTYQHIALIDDVITTGGTLEAIIHAIRENNPEIRISVISLALAK